MDMVGGFQSRWEILYEKPTHLPPDAARERGPLKKA